MEFLNELVENCSLSIVTAFLLGLFTSVCLCPLATNMAAIGYVSKELDSRNRLFVNSLLYTLGRMVAYGVLGGVLIAVARQGTDLVKVQEWVGHWVDRLLAPVLIFMGSFMLFCSKFKLPRIDFWNNWKRETRVSCGSLLLGMLFALVFSPSSLLIYFGMLLPMSVAETGGYFLPLIYAFATALPVIIVAWILAYSVSRINTFYDKMKAFQWWLNVIVGVLFMLVGIYYALVLLYY